MARKQTATVNTEVLVDALMRFEIFLRLDCKGQNPLIKRLRESWKILLNSSATKRELEEEIKILHSMFGLGMGKVADQKFVPRKRSGLTEDETQDEAERLILEIKKLVDVK